MHMQGCRVLSPAAVSLKRVHGGTDAGGLLQHDAHNAARYSCRSSVSNRLDLADLTIYGQIIQHYVIVFRPWDLRYSL